MRRLVIVLLVASCSSQPDDVPLPFAPAGPEAAPAPSEPGPFPVGVRTMEWELEQAPDKPVRRITVEVWYPAVEEARGKPGATYDIRPYMSDAQREAVKDLPATLLQTTAVRDAAARTARGPFPLVVFSHGSNAMRWQSTFFTVLLASHGYVVAAPEHKGNTLIELFQNDSIGGTTIAAFENRPLDVQMCIDRLLEADESSPFHGLVDPDRIGVSGHSFGGFTSFRVAATDPRVKAIVPMAPPTIDLSLAGLPADFMLKTPTLILAAHEDQTLAWDESIPPSWARLTKPRLLGDISKGGHFTFSDLCAFDLSNIATEIGFADVSKALRDGCLPPAPPAAVAQKIINHLAIGFFNATLRGSTGSWDLLTQAKVDGISASTAVLEVDR